MKIPHYNNMWHEAVTIRNPNSKHQQFFQYERDVSKNLQSFLYVSLPEKCPNTELFLVHIFLYSNWIRTRNNSVFGHFSRSVCNILKFVSLRSNIFLRMNPWQITRIRNNNKVIQNIPIDAFLNCFSLIYASISQIYN